MRLKLLSYNIHKGFSIGNRRFMLSELRDAIREVHADLVFLQEVIGAHQDHASQIEEWPTETQFEFLADEMWSHHAYGRNAVYAQGHHGNAILSKFPVVHAENVDVTNTRLQQRGILYTRLAIPELGCDLHAMCVHMDLHQRGRNEQIARLCQLIEERVPKEAPLIVAGDFNDWRLRTSDTLAEQVGLQEVFRSTRGQYARTFPSLLPVLALDRIYYRNIKVVEAQPEHHHHWRRLSDHVPLISTFEIEAVHLK